MNKNKPLIFRTPFFSILLAIYPTLALFANNVFQAGIHNIVRPLIFSIIFCLILFGIFYFIFKRDIAKSAVITGLSVFLFFIYGHIHSLLNANTSSPGFFTRHIGLILLFAIVWVGVFVILKIFSCKSELITILNFFSMFLIVFPIGQLGFRYVGEMISAQKVKSEMSKNNSEMIAQDIMPDIYYIVTDEYGRPDGLLENYGIDVSDFIAQMEDIGFYYADQSMSNYGETFSSISSSLNMNYADSIIAELETNKSSTTYQETIKNNRVRSILEQLGYQTIAFETGYRWSELNDADIYYRIPSINRLSQLTPFEVMLFEDTLAYPFRGYFYQLFPVNNQPQHLHGLHIEAQLNLLSNLPKIAENPNTTFTFAHIIIPHVPYVFDTNGNVLSDPGYWSGDKASAVNEEYRLDGYQNAVKFISNQLLSIVKEILANSENPPIIVIQSDHGWRGEQRNDILNLYYFPDQNYSVLYPSITPVNTFRVIFDTYLNIPYELVEDQIHK